MIIPCLVNESVNGKISANEKKMISHLPGKRNVSRRLTKISVHVLEKVKGSVIVTVA